MRINLFSFLITMILSPFYISAQSNEENDNMNIQPFIRVFSNFKHGLTEEDRSTGFEIRRVYIGCKGKLNELLQAEVKLDIGSPDDLSQFSLSRRSAYFKTASITYSKDNLKGWFGLFDMQQFKTQEDFWGYRYIYKSFQDEHKFGPSADIGAGISYRFSNLISADLVLSNGEGYRNFEFNDFIKYGTGLTIKPTENYIIRLYYEMLRNETIQSGFGVFTGYNTPRYHIGAEYNYRVNNRFVNNQNLTGYSTYGTWIFSPKWEVFLRYDLLASNIPSGMDLPWNLYNDVTSLITGLQFIPADDLRVSLNYQDRFSLAKNGPDKAYIFLNVQFDLR